MPCEPGARQFPYQQKKDTVQVALAASEEEEDVSDKKLSGQLLPPEQQQEDHESDGYYSGKGKGKGKNKMQTTLDEDFWGALGDASHFPLAMEVASSSSLAAPTTSQPARTAPTPVSSGSGDDASGSGDEGKGKGEGEGKAARVKRAASLGAEDIWHNRTAQRSGPATRPYEQALCSFVLCVLLLGFRIC